MNQQPACPCQSGDSFQKCCQPILNGIQAASTPEALMRSRYTAYTLNDLPYLLASWHPSTRPKTIDPATIPHWLGLEIIMTNSGAGQENEGVVEFKASFLQNRKVSILHERSRFVKETGHWYYVDGEILPSEATTTPGRNSPCPCKSGKKFKKCCGP